MVNISTAYKDDMMLIEKSSIQKRIHMEWFAHNF